AALPLAPAPALPSLAPRAVPAVQDIAVVGLSCRFPGAANLAQFWSLLAEGRSAIGPVPARRWGYESGHHAGLLDSISHFDPAFFLTSQADARAMDPQALLLLEETLNLFCHAGYRLDELKGSPVGVYVGARSQHRADDEAFSKANNPVMTIGQNYLAANVSQFFDLQGPSLVLDSACSSALVGMHIAIQALRAGDITSAVVGGVSLLNTDGPFQVFEQRDILSREFHIFDARASGAVLGEGVGMVLLKTVD
ncbi:beta-ketoacyl [acyl carrier protein] synthase domain-containing protein, partial [Janthinobacterium sp. CG3]